MNVVGGLEWLGARARWALLLGCLAAVFLPAVSAAMRPAMPALVAMVYALSMTRLDLASVARGLLRPRRAALVLGAAAGLLTVATAIAWAAVNALGLGPEWRAAAVYTFAAPPIASAAGFCFILGLDAALALEITVAASLMMPALGPAIAHWLLGEAVPISPWELGLRTAAMIGAGTIAALIARRALGPVWIAERGRAFDGLLAIGMTLFVLPLFDGVGATVLERPGLALGFLALSSVFILAPHLAAPLFRNRARAGAVALVGGTRSIAIYMAALPPDPLFTLFVALYQLPMYATPLLLRRLYGGTPPLGPGPKA